MAKKLKDDPCFLLPALLAAILIGIYLSKITRNPAIEILSASIVLFALYRSVKALLKEYCIYLNGPRRFCKGKGIEIGSGRDQMIKGSLLVDMITDFSDKKPYKVDYIADAHELPEIESSSMDYVLASHVFEHLTNPIKAVLEWFRILKPGGVIWLRIPDKRKTFDRNRERTLLRHLEDDYKKNMGPRDPTHMEDCNKNSDPPRDVKHPYIHNHVWIPEDIVELFDHINRCHAHLKIERCEANTCRNAQDFWVVVRKA